MGATKARGATIGKVYQLVPVIGPSAGVDLRTSPTLMDAQRARTLTNWSLSEPGALTVRAGWAQFTSTSLGAGRLRGVSRVYLNTSVPAPASTTFTLAGYAGGIYSVSDNGVWSSALQTGLSTREYDFVSDRDMVAVFDGASTAIWKSTNGSSWTRFGIAPGAAGPTLSTGSTGAMTSGTYEISYTYKDRGMAHESNGALVSTLTAVLTGSSGSINVVIPNSTDPQVDAIVVYARKVSAGETVKRKVSSLSQSVGANSTLIISSTDWTTSDEIPTDHDVPPALAFGVVWKNRWWARDAVITNRICFTQLFDPQSWPALFFIDIPFGKGDVIQAMVPFGDSLVIFGTTRNYVITGQTSLDFDVRPTIGSQDGALGFRAACVLENGIVHAGATGIYNFDMASDKLLTYDIDPAWQDLIANADAGDLAKVALVYHRYRKELRVAVPRVYPTASEGEWILDLNRTRTAQHEAWTTTDRNIGGYCLWDGPEGQAGNQQRLLSWTTDVALLNEESVGKSANGADLVASYEGPGLTLGTHRGRWIDLRIEYEPHSGALVAEALVDGLTQGTQNVPIGTGLSVYGTGTYGSATYAGAGRRQAYLIHPLGSDGRSYVQKLIYTGQDALRIFSYNPGLVPETQSRSFTE